MGRPIRHVPSHIAEHLVVYRRPDPVLVAKIVDEYSLDAACERRSSMQRRTIIDLARQGRQTQADRGIVDTSAMRDCVECERPFFSASSRNVVCRPCRAESTAVFA